MLTIIIIIAAIIALLIGIFVFARLFNHNDTKAQSPSVSKITNLTAEQDQNLKAAHSKLVSIRMSASRLKDSEISKGCIAACDSIERILQTLKEKPEKIQTSGQLFNYYIPTLEKVISKYQRIESSGVSSDDIPEKLKGYLGDISSAMGNMYEGLFENDKLHVEVDMEAMTMAIKRDGLLDEEDFKTVAR